MNLDRMTITGADDSVSPESLADLTAEFPFVEWGILFSPTRQGKARYPSAAWVRRLAATRGVGNLSAHLCGAYVRDLLAGGRQWFADNYTTQAAFGRLQVNAGATYAGPAEPAFFDVLRDRRFDARGDRDRQYIFQSDGSFGGLFGRVNTDGEGIDAVPLFDLSGGNGTLPGEWPRAEFIDVHPDADGNPVEVPGYHGYAGGLGPETLAEQLPRIAEAAGAARVWVDMESRVRSDHDRLFDLAKVRRCLEIAAEWVGKPAAGAK